MAKTWKDSDISLDPIKNQTIAVIGYGIQGDAQANNLKDSGLKVIVGLKEGSPTWNKAKSDGHTVMSVAEATKKGDIVHILIPDMIQARVYREEIGPNLSKGKALSFSHAAAIHWMLSWLHQRGLDQRLEKHTWRDLEHHQLSQYTKTRQVLHGIEF